MNRGFLESLKNSNHLHSSALFKLNNVNVVFGKVSALKNVNLQIGRGEVLFVTGKSGAGKSTLLNILSGDVEPTSGSVTLPTSKVFVSQVFQDLKLFENRTVEENLWYAYDKKIYKNKNEFQKDLMELSSVLGIKDRLSHKIKDANGGMKQKVAMLRALLSKPEVLLADEPTGNLDPTTGHKILKIFEQINKEGTCVVMATHNYKLISDKAYRVIELNEGRIVSG
mgnify:CR=1 FL=1